MFRKTALTIATAAIITAAAMGATASTESAGFKVYLAHSYGHGWRGHGYYNPCRRWLKKYRWTGRYRYLRKYRRCMHRYY